MTFPKKIRNKHLFTPERTLQGIHRMSPLKSNLTSQWTSWSYYRSVRDQRQLAVLPTNPPPNGSELTKCLPGAPVPLRQPHQSLTSELTLGIVTIYLTLRINLIHPSCLMGFLSIVDLNSFLSLMILLLPLERSTLMQRIQLDYKCKYHL